MSKLDPALLAPLLWPAMAVSKEHNEKGDHRLAELWGSFLCPFVWGFFPKCFQIQTVQFLSSHLGKDSGKAFKTQCSVSKNSLKT